MAERTFVIGDVHGELQALLRLMERLPAFNAQDTVVFLGDYVDRGADSAGVVAWVRQFISKAPCRVVALRGNHEQKWIECHSDPNPGFLLSRGNGCMNTYRSFVGKTPIRDEDGDWSSEDVVGLLGVRAWLPKDVVAWFVERPLFYEDQHGIYVHAGLEGENDRWLHPSESRPASLLWMREPDFFRGYRGKRLVFGHTPVAELPADHLGLVQRLFADPGDVWVRGDLIGIDTGSGKGGFLSAIELPRMKIYESR